MTKKQIKTLSYASAIKKEWELEWHDNLDYNARSLKVQEVAHLERRVFNDVAIFSHSIAQIKTIEYVHWVIIYIFLTMQTAHCLCSLVLAHDKKKLWIILIKVQFWHSKLKPFRKKNILIYCKDNEGNSKNSFLL